MSKGSSWLTKLLYLLIQSRTDNSVIARVEAIVSYKIFSFALLRNNPKKRAVGLAKVLFGRTSLTHKLAAAFWIFS